MHVYESHASLMGLGEGVEFPGTGVIDGCDLLCGYWESNLGSLQ